MKLASVSSIEVGERIVLARSFPMDFEGAGPRPGAAGQVVRCATGADPHERVGVLFDEVVGEWPIARKYLESQREER